MPAERVVPSVGVVPDARDHRAPEVRAGVTMADASRLLGVPAPTLRAWELRYGVPATTRASGKHRRFSDAALAQIALLRDEIARGTRAAEAADMVLALTANKALAGPWVSEFLDAARRMDPPHVRAALDAAVAAVGLATTLDEVLLPAMRQIGWWWSSGNCDVAHEHLATATARAWLGWHTTRHAAWVQAAPIVLACGPRDEHTISLEALGALLCERGQPIVLLGAKTPARDLQKSVRATGAGSVVVASQMPTGRREAIEAIRLAAETGVPVFYAGTAFLAFRRRTGIAGSYLGRNLAAAAEALTSR